MARHLNQGSERDPLKRNRMSAPKRIKIDAVTVIRANHGETGEPALSCFSLLNDWQAAPTAEIQQTRQGNVVTLTRELRIGVRKKVRKSNYYSRELLADTVYWECAEHTSLGDNIRLINNLYDAAAADNNSNLNGGVSLRHIHAKESATG